MPKQKTRKSLAKRIKITGTGKLMRYLSGGNHLKSSKSKSRLRKQRKTLQVAQVDAKKFKKMLPYGV